MLEGIPDLKISTKHHENMSESDNLRQRKQDDGEKSKPRESRLDACQAYQKETDKMVKICLLSVSAVLGIIFVLFIFWITSDEGGLKCQFFK